MVESTRYRRMLDESIIPDDNLIAEILGKTALKRWNDIREFLTTNYDFPPELSFYGRKYGWSFRYRRKGKTLCTMFPEEKSFTVLVTLGRQEIEKAGKVLAEFNNDTRDLFQNAHQYHDGKWLFKRIRNLSDLKDVKTLITIKKKPGP
jgi:hypothetical protein